MKNLDSIYNKKTLDILEDIVFVKDPKGIYLFVNKAYCKFANKKRKLSKEWIKNLMGQPLEQAARST